MQAAGSAAPARRSRLQHQSTASTDETEAAGAQEPAVVSQLQARFDALALAETQQQNDAQAAEAIADSDESACSPLQLEPTVLILDRHLQSMPWESLPSFQHCRSAMLSTLCTVSDELSQVLLPVSSEGIPLWLMNGAQCCCKLLHRHRLVTALCGAGLHCCLGLNNAAVSLVYTALQPVASAQCLVGHCSRLWSVIDLVHSRGAHTAMPVSCRMYRSPSLACAAAVAARQHPSCCSSHQNQPKDCRAQVAVDLASTVYMVNPAGDLASTQSTFEKTFSGQESWQVCSTTPCLRPKLQSQLLQLPHAMPCVTVWGYIQKFLVVNNQVPGSSHIALSAQHTCIHLICGILSLQTSFVCVGVM